MNQHINKIIEYQFLYLTKAYFNQQEYSSQHSVTLRRKLLDNKIHISTTNKTSNIILNNDEIISKKIIEYVKEKNMKYIQRIKLSNILINNRESDTRNQNYIQFVKEDNDVIESIIVSPLDRNNDNYLLSELNFLEYKCMFMKMIKKRNKLSEKKYIENILMLKTSGAVLFHEMICHAYERDHAVFAQELLEKIKKKKFNENLCVYDDNYEYEDICGINNYDDFGNIVRPFYFIENGIPNNDIYDEYYGNMISEKLSMYPLPRMRSTKILPYKKGKTSQEIVHEYINRNQNICFVLDIKYGTSLYYLSSFDLIGEVIIKKKSRYYYSNDCHIKGDTIPILKSIKNITKDTFNKIMACGKMGQNVMISIESPSFSISNAYIEGNFYEIEEEELWKLMRLF